MDDKELVSEQIRYYRDRAPEYDEFFLRRGRYDKGPEHRARWEAEVAEVREALAAFDLGTGVLEIACGTGWWTAELAARGVPVTALDASAEVLARNRRRLAQAGLDPDRVRYVESDVFRWEPDGAWDTVFMGFWLSHVPPGRFEAFWSLVARCLKPDGRVFFVDTLWHPEYRWTHPRAGADAGAAGGSPAHWVAHRELNDGRTYDIVKVFYEAEELTERLGALGWKARVSETETFFIWGSAERSGP